MKSLNKKRNKKFDKYLLNELIIEKKLKDAVIEENGLNEKDKDTSKDTSKDKDLKELEKGFKEFKNLKELKEINKGLKDHKDLKDLRSVKKIKDPRKNFIKTTNLLC